MDVSRIRQDFVVLGKDIGGTPDIPRQRLSLKSRFESRIAFPDYSLLELGQMLANMATGEGYILPEEVQQKALVYLKSVRDEDMHFDNGRTVRHLFGVKMSLARRLMTEIQSMEKMEIDKDYFVTFSTEDVPVLLTFKSASDHRKANPKPATSIVPVRTKVIDSLTINPE